MPTTTATTAMRRQGGGAQSSEESATPAIPRPQQYARQGSKLPREVLTWLQSIGMDAAVKHPRHDLASGFRVGEIVAKYWRDVPMHSLSTEVGQSRRRGNWRVLEKVFGRHGVPLSAEMAEGVLAARDPRYAEVLLMQLYSLLTGKKLRPPASEEELALPPIAAPAAPYQPPHVVGVAGNRAGPGGAGGGVGAEMWAHLEQWQPQDDEEDGAATADGDGAPDEAQRRLGHMAARGLLSSTTRDGSPRPPPVEGLPDIASASVNTDADELSGGRPRVRLAVSVRPAQAASTIVSGQPAQPSGSRKGSGSAADVEGSAASAAALVDVDVTINAEVARWLAAAATRAVQRRSAGAPPVSSAPGDIGRLLLLLAQPQHQDGPGSLWGLLEAHSAQMAAHARADATVMPQIVELLLRAPLHIAANTAAEEERRRALTVATRSLRTLAVIAGAVASLDPYRATVVVEESVLLCRPVMALCLQLRGDDGLVCGLAALMLVVTTASTPQAAATQLSGVCATLGAALAQTGCFAPEETVVLLLNIHRALLTLAAAAGGRKGGAAAAASSAGGAGAPSPSPATAAAAVGGGSLSGAPSTAPAGAGVAEEQRPRLNWLADTGRRHAVETLRREPSAGPSPTAADAAGAPRVVETVLAAARLAVAVLETENTMGRCASQTVEELSPLLAGVDGEGARGPSVVTAVRVSWLRAVVAASTTGRTRTDAAAATAELGRCCELLSAAPETSAEGDAVANGLAALLSDAGAIARVYEAPDAAGFLPAAEAAAAADAIVRYFAGNDPARFDAAALSGPAPNGTGRCLALSEALARLLPSDGDEEAGSGTTEGVAAERKGYPPATVPAAAVLRRRLTNAATAVTREGGVIADRTRVRLQWLAHMTAQEMDALPGGPAAAAAAAAAAAGGGGGGGSIAMNAASAAAAAAAQALLVNRETTARRWRPVILAFYEDVVIVTTAADSTALRLQQQQQHKRAAGSGPLVSPEQAALMALGSSLQRVVNVWHGLCTGGLHAAAPMPAPPNHRRRAATATRRLRGRVAASSRRPLPQRRRWSGFTSPSLSSSTKTKNRDIKRGVSETPSPTPTPKTTSSSICFFVFAPLLDIH